MRQFNRIHSKCRALGGRIDWCIFDYRDDYMWNVQIVEMGVAKSYCIQQEGSIGAARIGLLGCQWRLMYEGGCPTNKETAHAEDI